MTKDEARELLESVLDTLVEVGNGTTDEQLREAANRLFLFRDQWFNSEVKGSLNGSKSDKDSLVWGTSAALRKAFGPKVKLSRRCR